MDNPTLQNPGWRNSQEIENEEKVSRSDFSNFGLFRNRIPLSKRELSFDKEQSLLIIPASLFLSVISEQGRKGCGS